MIADESGKPFEFTSIPQPQMEKMISEIKAIIDKNYPTSAANGVAGLLYVFDSLLHLHIQEGIFPLEMRDIFAEQLQDSLYREIEERTFNENGTQTSN